MNIKKIMKKINYPLWIGVTILTVLLFVSLFPQKFTSQDPTFFQTMRFERTVENGQTSHRIVAPPWGPTEENIMGTDEFGRDIYSRLVYGTKTTLTTALLVVLFRILLAVPIGMLAGIGSKTATSLIRFWNTVFTAIPTLFVAFVIFNIKYIAGLHVDNSIIAFAIVLTALGWGKLAKQVEEVANRIMKEDFIEGEVAVGKNKIQIALQNMLPHLVPSLISLVFIEVGMVIFLLAQLSVLQVFVGPRAVLERVDESRLAVAINPEWASMLSRGAIQNRLGNYWVSLFPALAFSIGILGFNLTGEGLRFEFEKRTSRVTSTIRRFGFIFSPKIYLQQILRFREYSKPVIIKTLCIILIIAYLAIPAPKSLYPFEVELAMEHLEELIKPEYEGRLAGFEGGYLAADYIVGKLKEYGLEPYDGENYLQSFPFHRARPTGAASMSHGIVDDGTINLTSSDGETTTYHLNDDFIVASYNMRNMNTITRINQGTYTVNLSGISSTVENLQTLKESREIDNLMMVRKIGNENIRQQLSREQWGVLVQFLILEEGADFPVIPTFLGQQHNIIPKGELAEKLMSGHYEVEINTSNPKFPEEGRNIFAVLPGKDWGKPDDSNDKKEVIIIGATYDGLGMVNNRVSAAAASRPAMNLEIARVLSQLEEPLDKTIVFAFWDGVSVGSPGPYFYNMFGRLYGQQYYQIYYFDVGYASDDDEININVLSPPMASQVETFDLVKGIEKRLKKSNVAHVSTPPHSSSYHYIGSNLSLKISADTVNYSIINTERDTVENINRDQMKNIGQFFIDLITMDKNLK